MTSQPIGPSSGPSSPEVLWKRDVNVCCPTAQQCAPQGSLLRLRVMKVSREVVMFRLHHDSDSDVEVLFHIRLLNLTSWWKQVPVSLENTQKGH